MKKLILAVVAATMLAGRAGATCTTLSTGLKLQIPAYSDNGATWATCFINDLNILNLGLGSTSTAITFGSESVSTMTGIGNATVNNGKQYGIDFATSTFFEKQVSFQMVGASTPSIITSSGIYVLGANNGVTANWFSGLLRGNADTASLATAVAGGGANQFYFQTGAGAGAFLPQMGKPGLIWGNGAAGPSTGTFTVGASLALSSTTGNTSIDAIQAITTLSSPTFAQGKFSTSLTAGTTAIDATAFVFVSTKAFNLFSPMSNTEVGNLIGKQDGGFVFNTTFHKFEYYSAGDASFVYLATTTASGSASVPISTYQEFKSGSGATYTTPAGVRQIEVEGCGAGGGGAAVTTNNGTAGGDSSFAGVVAKGAAGEATGNSNAGGIGGSGGTDNGLTGVFRRQGGGGCGPTYAGGSYIGSCGGNSAWAGGGGNGGANGGAGGNAAANTGGGGGGGGGGGSAGGAGAGECVKFIINSPAGTYTYTVGAKGVGGAAGGFKGGDGADGYWRVRENY